LKKKEFIYLLLLNKNLSKYNERFFVKLDIDELKNPLKQRVNISGTAAQADSLTIILLIVIQFIVLCLSVCGSSLAG
jgi:hypothetical protein